jgi:UDP-glucose 4-epimerase
MRTLVTGGAGAIGSNLVRRLVARGDDVVVLDDLTSGYAENVPEGVRLVAGDVSKDETLDRAFDGEGFDRIFHLAALFANQNSVDHPERDLEVNSLGSLKLAQRASKQRHTLGRLLYVSSSCVYGGYAGCIPETAPFDPHTPYAITKLNAEFYFHYFHQHHGLPVTTVRPFNSYGPGERPGRYRNVIPNFARLALRGEPLVITGTGEETRDFTYVDDLVEGMLLASESEAANGRTYNLASGRETTILDLARMVVAAAGSESPVVFGERRSWDRTSRRWGDISRARADFGFDPKVTVAIGVPRTVEWIRDHTDVARSGR